MMIAMMVVAMATGDDYDGGDNFSYDNDCGNSDDCGDKYGDADMGR